MPQSHSNRRKKKSTGGRKKHFRKKKRYEIGSDPIETILAKRRTSTIRARGGRIKVRLLGDNYANVYDPETGMVARSMIRRVEGNPANRDYERRGVITKGAIILTESGRAVVTSRPGQDGVINARAVKS